MENGGKATEGVHIMNEPQDVNVPPAESAGERNDEGDTPPSTKPTVPENLQKRADEDEGSLIPCEQEKQDEETAPPAIQTSTDEDSLSTNADGEMAPAKRTSSLEMRKQPVHGLLFPVSESCFFDVKPDDETFSTKHGLLRLTCLNPKFTLRTQLMLSFGSVNFITIFLVVLVCVLVALMTGNNIKAINQQTFQSTANAIQARTARYLAESLEHRLIPKDVVMTVYELTRDRFQGFPQFLNDEAVPFRDMDTNTSKYPLTGPPLPLDWQIQDNITESTDEEHVQGRRAWYGNAPLSTSSGAFIMQGACDPSTADPMSRTYWENCTEASNDIATGGTMAPSNLTQHIHRKASELVPALKALYEYNENVREIGVYFANQGVGATVNFPHYELDAQTTYVAVGCDWMKAPNPYDPSRPIGTQEEIDRCYKQGTELSSRQYNPLGREWCRTQALQPEETLVEGPFLDAFVDNNWMISAGRAVYDRESNDFLACIFIGVSTDFLENIMREARVTPNSEVSVVRWDSDGTVLASSAWNTSESGQVVTIGHLEIGLTNETYGELYTLVDYDSTWDPAAIQQAYHDFSAQHDGFFVAVYPIPPIPDEFDPDYHPVFLAVVSTDDADVFDKVDEVNEDVDEHVDDAILFSVVVGAAGFICATIVILITSSAITRPLNRMNKQAEQIVGSFGDDDVDAKQIEPVSLTFSRCRLRTEITEVVEEFNQMVSSFSGSLVATSERGKYVEIPNDFDLRPDFSDLYRNRTDLPSVVTAASNSTMDRNNAIHIGSNLNTRKIPSRRHCFMKDDVKDSEWKMRPSPLFVWIVILFVTPLLLTTITISAVVISRMSWEFDESVGDAETHFVEVSLQALHVYAWLRADFVAQANSRSIRDLYMLARYGNWLFFNGLERSGSFSEVVTNVNECLDAESSSTCPHAIENRVCDCDWNFRNEECDVFPDGSRNLQYPYFFVQADGALPNGTRLSTNFPENSFSSSSTLWWDGPYDVPGSKINASMSTYSTTHDRLRTASAVPLFALLNNYDVNKENGLGHFYAFEDDGLTVADEGCDNSENSYAAFWESTEENGAAEFRPELCPIGKFGYDPRCRGWYDDGRVKAIDQAIPLHVTAPYEFAGSSGEIAQSATSPLIDPTTGYHVGQVLVDFSITSTFSALTSSSTPLSKGGFPLLITVESDAFGGDTVIGPGLNGSVSTKPASETVIPYDQNCPRDIYVTCSTRNVQFEDIVESMKAGNASIERFERTTESGGTETVFIAYAPVLVKFLSPTMASDFSRGALSNDYMIYSLGLAETERGVLEPFEAIEEDMQRQRNVAIGILAAVIVLALAADLYISYLFARSISEPMRCLLDLIQSLNHLDVDEEPPTIDNSMGSKEIVNVTNTMESLYRVVRLATASYYAGDLEAAYRVLLDAVRLFKRLDNQKAIGVACNNLGNTLLAIYREMKSEKVDSKFGLSQREVIAKGMAYFHEAIQLGETAYDEFFAAEGWSPSCLEFMQHLSSRYFNRGIFLLTIKDDHEQPEEIEQLGFRDLEISRDMDEEIVDQGEESGWGRVNRAEKLFDVWLVRVRGQLLLIEMGYPDKWETDTKLDDLFKLVADEARNPRSILFHDISEVGRLQEVESEMMKYLLIKGEVAKACSIALRMLFEDEFVILDSEAQALTVLQVFVNSDQCDFDDETRTRLNDSLEDLLDELSAYLDCRSNSAAVARDHSIASKSLRGFGRTSEKGSSSLRWSISECSGKFVTMEQF